MKDEIKSIILFVVVVCIIVGLVYGCILFVDSVTTYHTTMKGTVTDVKYFEDGESRTVLTLDNESEFIISGKHNFEIGKYVMLDLSTKDLRIYGETVFTLDERYELK